MNDKDVERIETLMRRRDHSDLLKDLALKSLLMELADEVPGMLTEIKRLRKELRLAYEGPNGDPSAAFR